MSDVNDATARVVVQPRSLRSLRCSLALTRWVFYVTAAVGVAATVRFTIVPPTIRGCVYNAPTVNDPGAEWFAEQFARAYLSWTSNLAARERGLTPFLGASSNQGGGIIPARDSDQQVESVGIARGVMAYDGTVEYTVAVQTSRLGLLYLAVDVARAAHGRYLLVDYPAIVGAPAFETTAALDGPGLPVVTNRALETTLDRALSDYLDSSTQSLRDDLAPGASVESPTPALALDEVQHLAVEPSGVILATVVASDRLGDSYTLDYTVGAVLRSGRWEVSAIGPTAGE